MGERFVKSLVAFVGCWIGLFANIAHGELLHVAVTDARTHDPLACRVYLENEAGDFLFVKSADPAGSALPYTEQWVPMPHAVERHTTVSAHPFEADVPPGDYTLTIERGKEYCPWRQRIEVRDRGVDVEIELRRWIDLSARGFYSGETHVHRRLEELPNVMMAEDLNVAFPVTFWTVRSDRVPDLAPSTLRSQGPSPWGPRVDRGSEPIAIDATHVILPRNTEYEIFSVGETRHTLGAIFVLNHRQVFEETAPPIAPIARAAHEQGALLDLDKHSWPWSMMLVPVASIDLFELSNNSVWRTEFGFNSINGKLPPWVELEHDSETTLTEWGWLQYGFEVYYALLNCGFEIAPTAGTASGVHPVPLGYSRVYVELDEPFTVDRWLDGLRQGRSFVTTGPMLFARLNEQAPGARLEWPEPGSCVVEFETQGEWTFERLEVLVNGEVVHAIDGPETKRAWPDMVANRVTLSLEETSWVAVRVIELRPDGRRRFAHTAPWYIRIGDEPIRPRREQLDYFIELMEDELVRNRPVLDPRSLAEFQQALDHYRTLLERAK